LDLSQQSGSHHFVAFEARCEAARTEWLLLNADPIVLLQLACWYSVKSKTDSSFLMCAAALLYFDATFYYNMRQNIPRTKKSLFIHTFRWRYIYV
jgi:hypothetical protein